MENVKTWSQFKKFFDKKSSFIEIIEDDRVILNKNKTDDKNIAIMFLTYTDLNNTEKLIEIYSRYNNQEYKVIPIPYYFISWNFISSIFDLEGLKNKTPTINDDKKFINCSCLGIHLFNSYLDTLYKWNKDEVRYLAKFWLGKMNETSPFFSIIPYSTHEIEWFSTFFLNEKNNLK